MSTSGSANYILLTRFAEEFAARYRAGERPTLQEYIDRNPELADDIRELFPAKVEIEFEFETAQISPGGRRILALHADTKRPGSPLQIWDATPLPESVAKGGQ